MEILETKGPEKMGQSGEDQRTRFAAEVTMLARIRTGLAMMGFGFVVSRFGLFLQELAIAQQHRDSVEADYKEALIEHGKARRELRGLVEKVEDIDNTLAGRERQGPFGLTIPAESD